MRRGISLIRELFTPQQESLKYQQSLMKETSQHTKARLQRHAFYKGELKEGDEVSLKINESNRKLYARIHSAGHLLDVAFHGLGYKNEGTKGYHFPKGSYVEYAGKVDLKDPKKFIEDMEKRIKDLITVR